jgi:hypothetical protein
MIKRILTLAILVTFVLSGTVVAELSKTAPMVNHKLMTGNEELPLDNAIPYTPGFSTDSPGYILGTTYYDYQSNGSSGNRIVICPDNSKYAAWMRGFGWPYPPALRHVYYNWADPDTFTWQHSAGSQVSENTNSGYTNIDIIDGNHGVIAYHKDDDVYVAIEGDPIGYGQWHRYTVPNRVYPQSTPSPGICAWPYIAVDSHDYIHVVTSENTNKRIQRLLYTRSEDGGESWVDTALVDTVMVIGAVIAASPVSGRVVVAYPRSQDTTTQWKNDIYYVVTDTSGTDWDWRYGKHNVTNYLTDNDSLWAYTDMDVIIDYNDNINLIWNAQWVTDESIYFKTFLFFYNEEANEIVEITHKPESLWVADIEGAWNRTICKMNLGVHESSEAIFATWTQFDTSDVSAGGFANGDLFMSYTVNNGYTWTTPVNMTNSQTPNCWPGECDSDHWSTLADVVDDNLHIFYTNDKDAGGIPQTEGQSSENPMMYLEYPNPLATGIKDNDNRPANYSLAQNYPNPFNAKTVISFELKNEGPVTLDVYNITGAKVTTLVDGVMNAGQHQVTWDASDAASGVYYYRINANGINETKQAVLIK